MEIQARLDFRRSLVSGRSASSFPEQRLVIEPRFKLMRKEEKPNVWPDEIGAEAGLKYVDSVFTVRKTGFIYYLLTESEVITGKSQTKALMY